MGGQGMNTDSFINKWLDTGAMLTHRASLKWLHIGGGLLGLLLLLGAGPEFIVSRDTAEMMLRDGNGNLPEGSGPIITITALLFCGIMLALFHKPVGRLRKSLTATMLFWLLILAGAVTLSQPIISLLSELRFGNSLEAGV